MRLFENLLFSIVNKDFISKLHCYFGILKVPFDMKATNKDFHTGEEKNLCCKIFTFGINRLMVFSTIGNKHLVVSLIDVFLSFSRLETPKIRLRHYIFKKQTQGSLCSSLFLSVQESEPYVSIDRIST